MYDCINKYIFFVVAETALRLLQVAQMQPNKKNIASLIPLNSCV